MNLSKTTYMSKNSPFGPCFSFRPQIALLSPSGRACLNQDPNG